MIRIYVTSVYVDDQDKALEFYTDVLGFEKKTDLPMGEFRWLTVVSPAEPDGPDAEPASCTRSPSGVVGSLPAHRGARRW